MKKILITAACITVLTSFKLSTTLTGLWEYSGGVYNGKTAPASKDYKLQRKYSMANYQAFFLEPGQPPVIYEKGNYQLMQDTCLETQTYSKMPSKTTGLVIRYHYQIKNDTLTFNGVLPNGTMVHEYWKKIK